MLGGRVLQSPCLRPLPAPSLSLPSGPQGGSGCLLPLPVAMASQLATTIFRHKIPSEAPSAKSCRLAQVSWRPAEIPGVLAHEQLPGRRQIGVPVSWHPTPRRLEGSRLGSKRLAGSCAKAPRAGGEPALLGLLSAGLVQWELAMPRECLSQVGTNQQSQPCSASGACLAARNKLAAVPAAQHGMMPGSLPNPQGSCSAEELSTLLLSTWAVAGYGEESPLCMLLGCAQPSVSVARP